MKQFFTWLLIGFITVMAPTLSYAKGSSFGGFHSSSSFSSSHSSSFGSWGSSSHSYTNPFPSRSYSLWGSASSAQSRVSSGSVYNSYHPVYGSSYSSRPIIVNHYHDSGYGWYNPMGWFFLGSMMDNHTNTVIVQQPNYSQPGYNGQGYQDQNYNQPSSGTSFLGGLFDIIIFVVILSIIGFVIKSIFFNRKYDL